MGRITAGIGLMSGMDISSIVDQLMKLEQRPLDILANRQADIDARRTAVMDVSALIMSARMSTSSIRSSKLLQSTAAVSSKPDMLAATASNGASPGTYSFRVGRLVSAQQMLSSGLASTTEPAFSAGTLTIQSAKARLVDDTRLDVLNGQQGVRLGRVRITDRSGASALIDFSTAVTVNDVLDAINNSDAINVRASTEGGRLVIDDLTGSTAGSLAVSEVSGGYTAADLGILGTAAATRISGGNLISVNEQTPLTVLNHGIGVQRNAYGDDLSFMLADGTAFNVNLTGAQTLGDVVTAINEASAASANPDALVASISAEGVGLVITDNSGGAGTLTVASAADSRAAHDLGIAGSDADGDGTISGGPLLADLQSVLLSSLNGGNGLSRGVIQITDRAGTVSQIDLSAANTVQDVLAAINNPATLANVTASFNAAANKIVLTDNTGQSGQLIIEDSGTSTMATELGLVGTFQADSVSGEDLARQFVSLDTRVDTLNSGAGISLGRFTITNGAGAAETINLTNGTYDTVGDIVLRINSNAIGVTARINDTGDGIVLDDASGGAGQMSVTDDSGSSARDLHILGTAEAGETFIDGSSRISISVDENDTLESLRVKMNDAGAGIIVNLMNDGSAIRPHRLSVVSTVSGAAGSLMIDGSEIGLDLTEMARGRDAVLSIGDGQTAAPMVVTSRTNTFSGLIAGVTLDAKAASGDQTVTVSITRDAEAVRGSVNSMLGSLNAVLQKIASYTKYDTEKQQGAILQGNGAMISAQRRIFTTVMGNFSETGSRFRSLSAIGIKLKDGQFEIDESRFNAAFNANPQDVEKLFLDTENGVVNKVSDLMNTLGTSGTGALSIQATQLEDQSKMVQTRIDGMSTLLEMKRERLIMQFMSMERALGQMQNQQSALTSLQQLASSFTANK